MNKRDAIINYLDRLYPDAKCNLNYTKDYDLLIATMLSAQTTDKKVNEVTEELFKYDLEELKDMPIDKLEAIIKPLGFYKKKALNIKSIASRLLEDHGGAVPNDRAYLESLDGVGRKTTNVVLSNLFNEPLFAVDTHVSRVSKRLGIANKDDSPYEVEEKLNKYFPKNKRGKLHHQFIYFGRNLCKSQNPKCEICELNSYCEYYNNSDKNV